MKITPSISQLLDLANRILTRGDDGGAPVHQNGVGFSGADYPAMSAILATIATQDAWVSPGQANAIADRIKKYGRQAQSLGFDLSNILERLRLEVPPVEAKTVDSGEPLPEATDDGIYRALHAVAKSAYDRRIPAPMPPHLTIQGILGAGGLFANKLPGYEARQPQINLAVQIETAFVNGTPLLAEAGTGTGKSFAYLIPAIQSGKKTIVSTEGKALQDQLFGKDLPFLRDVLPIPFTFAKLKGLSNYVCRDALEETNAQSALFGASTEHGFAQIRDWVRELDATDSSALGDIVDAPITVSPELLQRITTTSEECTGSACAYYANCFAYRARAVAKEADILVVNHALLSLDVSLRRMSGGAVAILPDRDQVVIDEAHSLEDIFTGSLTQEASNGRVASVTRGKYAAMCAFTPEMISSAVGASDAFFAVLDRTLGDKTTAIVAATPAIKLASQSILSGLAPLIRLATRASHDGANAEPVNAKIARFVERIEKVREVFADLAREAEDDSGYDVIYGEREESRNGTKRLTLKIAPISVASALRTALWERWPTVATSATLTAATTETGGSPFNYFRERCGVPDCSEFRADSPFDYRKNALLFLPSPGFQFDPSKYYQDGSIDYFDRIANTITELLLASDGRAFVLFTSRRALKEVHGRIGNRLKWNVLVQGDAPPAVLIRRFKDDGHSVLFGLKSFWTGVDVQGSALSLVIIDKLPFPTPDEPVFSARCAAINKAAGDRWAWFNKLAIPIASQTIAQGVGRLIRNNTDTGVIALLDGRLTGKNYGPSMLRVLPPATQTRSMDAVRAFFAANAGGK